MLLLALDTSTEALSIALWHDGAILSKHCHAGQRHAELTLPMLDALFAEAGMARTQLEAIAYPLGPGSFTGLRIGCGLAQGIGQALDIPLVGISSLATLAAGSDAAVGQVVLAALDARMNQVYAGLYQHTDQGWQTLTPDGLFNPEDVPLPTTAALALGNAFAAYPALTDRLPPTLHVLDPHRLPHAAHLAALGAAACAAGLAIPAEQAGLVYLRDQVALTSLERAAKAQASTPSL